MINKQKDIMADNQYINPNNPVYFSYAWEKTEYPGIEKDVNALCGILESNHIYYKRDKENLCPYRWSIKKAMDEIGEGTAIIVVISKRYLNSLDCMYEWHQMREFGRIWERVFPIVLDDAKITKDDIFQQYLDFFQERKKNILKKLGADGKYPSDVVGEAVKEDFFIHDLYKIKQYLVNFNRYSLDKLRANNYAILINQLTDHLVQAEKAANNNTSTDYLTGNFPKVFSVDIPDRLLRRDKEADNLYKGVQENRFFNLFGVGGCGKSSLAYLMIQKHESDFNEIAYVIVNGNIKKEIVSQLNETLSIDFKEDQDDYKQIVTYLENNFKSKKPNLLVLDINELSAFTKDFVKNINKNCPKNWKGLIISRENVDTLEIMAKEDLNQNHDIEFLKGLFLKRTGARYEGFKNFDELFETIFYNPLLAEQLGFYLSKQPETKSVEEIKKILYAENFKNKDLKGYAITTNEYRSTMVNFLTNLIPYDTDYLDHNEKELLRHFILWPVDYLNYKVIKELLQGVFESDDILCETLSKLSERAILMTKTADDGRLSYELHGLLADSLREQVDVSKENYAQYLNKVWDLSVLPYADFIPFANCIGNSLCQYNITDNYKLLNCISISF